MWPFKRKPLPEPEMSDLKRLEVWITESEHFGKKHYNVMVQFAGGFARSTNDDYGWNTEEEARAEMQRVIKAYQTPYVPPQMIARQTVFLNG